MKKKTLAILFAAAALVAVSTPAMACGTGDDQQEQAQQDATPQITLGDFTIAVPAGMLQRQQSDKALTAFLPDGSYGMSLIIENMKPKEKQMRQLCQGLAKEMNLKSTTVEPLDLKGMKGYSCTGVANGMIATAAIVVKGHQTLKVAILEKESLHPQGIEMVKTIK